MRLPEPGDVVAGYRVEELLGQGGFAQVYRARGADGEAVAIKVLSPDDGETYRRDTRLRFEREAAALGGLSTPHVVGLRGRGETDNGLLYLVFDEVRAPDLSDMIDDAGTLHPELIRTLLTQLLGALQQAHDGGVLHRDIKPANIKVSTRADGSVQAILLDFGLARPTDDSHPRVTTTGVLLGTPRYMSPEQLCDQALSPASDIYSLGLVALELLAGVDALAGREVGAQLSRLISDEPFAGVGWGVDDGLRTVISRMIAVDPSVRFGSARAVLAALGPDAEQTTTTYETHARSRSGDASPRNSRRALTAAAGLMLVGCLTIAWLLNRHLGPQEGPAPAVQKPTRSLPAPTRPQPVEPQVHASQPDVGAKPVDGCAVAAPFVGRGLLEHPELDSVPRWLTFIPPDYDSSKRHPLLVAMHPGRVDGEVFVTTIGLDEAAQSAGVILIVPHVETDPIGRYSSHGRAARQAMDFLRGTLMQLCVDRERVGVVAHGDGAKVSFRMATEPEVTTMITGSYRADPADSAVAEVGALPHLMFAGRADLVDPLKGGRPCTSVIENVISPPPPRISLQASDQLWSGFHGCSGEPKSIYKDRHGECFEWRCGQRFVSCHHDGGHGWTGMPPRQQLEHCNDGGGDFAMNELTLDFLLGNDWSDADSLVRGGRSRP